MRTDKKLSPKVPSIQMGILSVEFLRGEHTERQASSVSVSGRGNGKVHWNALWHFKIGPPSTIFKRHHRLALAAAAATATATAADALRSLGV